MKNFKKVLALVLAIATLLSFATVASAKTTADFADANDVKNTEAVDVLTYIKVLEGYPADNTFKPAKNITREEAAKIIAIFANKSTDISSLYTSANPFADMKGRWGESYVAYGYRAGIIAGKNATSFVPKANVKGTEFLKMVLVVLGYDQNKEGLVGSSWAVNTLELAKAKKLLAGLGSDFDANAALTRDQAAQIMLNALKAEKVVYGQTITNLTWNAKAGYWMTTNTASNAVYVSPNGAVNNYEHKLLAADFGLTLDNTTNDEWGRPTHTWYKGTTKIKEYKTTDGLLATYYTAVTECDVAKDCDFTENTVLPFYLNGKENKVNDTIRPLAITTKIGAQGRLTEVYEDRVVMIDTFLAKVDEVKDATYDAAGHLASYASLKLLVYIADNTTATYVLQSTTNYSYVAGDYILLNAKTAQPATQRTASATALSYKAGTTTFLGLYGEIVGKAESFEGAQTVQWTNAAKHTVDGTTYDDALELHLDQAGNGTGKYTWFKDQYGNIIGVAEIATVYSYGVITKLFYSASSENGAGLGTGKYYATVKYMDGTENNVEVASIEVANVKYALAYGNAFANNMTFEVTTAATATEKGKGTLYVSNDYATNKKADQVEFDATAAPLKYDVIDGHLFKMSTNAAGKTVFERVEAQIADTFDASAAQTNKVYVNNKGGYIYSVPTTGNTTYVRVDSTTKFLYVTPLANGVFNWAGTYEYKTADGIANIPTFKTVKRLDYVLGSDNVADYVYIIGETEDSVVKEFVFGNTVSYKTVLADDGIDYYEVELPTKTEGGETATVKTAGTVKGLNLMTVLTDVNNSGKLFYVKYVNGLATEVTEIGTRENGYKVYDGSNTTGTAKSGVFTYDAVNKLSAVKLEGATIAGEIIMSKQTARYYKADGTVVYGELKDGATDNIIYIVYKETGTSHGAFIADKIYVTNKVTTPDNPYQDPWAHDDTRKYSYNVTDMIVVPDNADITIGELQTALSATATTGSYTVITKDQYGVEHVNVINAADSANANVKLATFLAAGATVKMTNTAGTWTIKLAK